MFYTPNPPPKRKCIKSGVVALLTSSGTGTCRVLLHMTRQSRSGCNAFWRLQHLRPQWQPAAGGMPPASLSKPNSPNLGLAWPVTGTLQHCCATLFVSRACKVHPPHRCSVSTCVATVTTSEGVGASVWLTVQITHYLHGLISHTTKSVSDLRYVSPLGLPHYRAAVVFGWGKNSF